MTSKYTRENPFEFEGVKVWRGYNNCIAYDRATDVHEPVPFELQARLFHAFIEAERDEWRYTNEDRTEARRGRWLARVETEDEYGHLFHDDFDDANWAFDEGSYLESSDAAGTSDVIGVYESFLTWHAAQNAQQEPTLGDLDKSIQSWREVGVTKAAIEYVMNRYDWEA